MKRKISLLKPQLKLFQVWLGKTKQNKTKTGWDTYSKISKQVVCIHQYLKEKQQILMLCWKHFNTEITLQIC